MDNYTLLYLIRHSLLRLSGFFRPTKMVGREWGKILAPHHEAGMVLDFLDPPYPVLLRVTKGYNCKFFIP